MAICSGEEIKKAAFGALLALQDNLPKGCVLSIEDEDEMKRLASAPPMTKVKAL